MDISPNKCWVTAKFGLIRTIPRCIWNFLGSGVQEADATGTLAYAWGDFLARVCLAYLPTNRVHISSLASFHLWEIQTLVTGSVTSVRGGNRKQLNHGLRKGRKQLNHGLRKRRKQLNHDLRKGRKQLNHCHGLRNEFSSFDPNFCMDISPKVTAKFGLIRTIPGCISIFPGCKVIYMGLLANYLQSPPGQQTLLLPTKEKMSRETWPITSLLYIQLDTSTVRRKWQRPGERGGVTHHFVILKISK